MDRAAAGNVPPLSGASSCSPPVNVTNSSGPSALWGTNLHPRGVGRPPYLLVQCHHSPVHADHRHEPYRWKALLSASGPGCLFRLLSPAALLPLLTWGVLRLLPLDAPLVVGVLVIIMAMPAAAVTSLLAETYDANTEFAAELVFLSQPAVSGHHPADLSAAVNLGSKKADPWSAPFLSASSTKK